MRPRIWPKGVGDLRLLRQQLSHYELGEIAHVENVMRTETRERTHRRRTQLETFSEQKEDREQESTRDVQTTERFELERETKASVQSQESFQAGANLSASYGPVSIGANVAYSISTSKEEAQRNATKFAKSIVDKAVDRVKATVSATRSTRLLEEMEEVNFHSFKNDDDEHVRGVYRWVNKVYRQKVVSYGNRLMYEFFVPEPARFFKFASAAAPGVRAPAAPTALVRDAAVPLTPDLITQFNYLDLVAQYNVTDVEPPPAGGRVVSKALSRQRKPNDTGGYVTLSLSENLELPPGYEAMAAMLVGSGEWQDGSGGFFFGMPSSALLVMVGETARIYVGGADFNDGFYLGGEQRHLPVSIVGQAPLHLALNLEVICMPTSAETKRWQLATFDAITLAYNRALASHRDRVEASRANGFAPSGRNPLENRALVKNELKKHCQTLWLGDSSPFLPAVDYRSEDEEPVLDQTSNEQNAAMLGLLEDSFEWGNLSFELLAPHYGSPLSRREAFDASDADPEFQRFLSAGYARVLVPVRSEAAAALLFFQRTGIVWEGADPPVFDEADEEGRRINRLLEDLEEGAAVEVPTDGAATELSADDPDTWLATVPTTLVYLQGGMDINDPREI